MMILDLIKDYLEGKVPTTLAVVLINLALLFALWTRVDDYEPRIRALEDYTIKTDARIRLNERFIHGEVSYQKPVD